MNSNLKSLLTALQQRADLAVCQPLITAETAKTKDAFYNLLPLYWALSYGARADVLRALLDANPAAAEEPNPEGFTPLHYVEKLDVEAVKLLLARCPSSARAADHEGALPLHWAKEHQVSPEILQLLLEAYPEAAAMRDRGGRLASQLAEEMPVLEAKKEPVGLIFPGPGVEHVGMLQSVQDLPAVKEMLAEAKGLLGFDLLQACLSGHGLQELSCSHAAVYLGSLAAMQKLKYPVGSCQAMAGMSLGDYAALTAAGVFSFKDGLQLVLERAKAIAQLPSEAVLCVGLSEPKVLELCLKSQSGEEVCEISGYLHKCCFMVGGTPAALQAFRSMAKDAKALQLDVGKAWGACHTKLMEPFRESFQAKLQAVLCRMSPPRCQVLLNGKTVDSSTDLEDVLRLLGEQLVQPVRWKESMEVFGKMGLDEIYECGPQKQLKALMKRINNDTWWRTGNVEV